MSPGNEVTKSVGIGIVGIGFMGMIHYLAARQVGGGKVVALASRDAKKLAGDWTSIRGNFGPKGSMMDLSGLNRHADVAGLLADPAVDLVDLCVPNDQHASLAIRALEAGKHVLVEKPIALTVKDADAMLAAAKASGRRLMVAHVLPFFPEFRYASQLVHTGPFGPLLAAHFTRVISRPDWSSGISDADRSGGPAIDLHIHDTHFVGLLCGTPRAVHTRGVVDRGAVAHLTTQYLYDPGGPAVSAVSGAICQSGRPFAHGFEIYLEGATLSFGPDTPLTVYGPDGSVDRPALGSTDPVDAFAAEIEAATSAVATGIESLSLSAELARNALALCHAEVESVKTGKAVELT